jgi:plasmid stabilization system protein ParE
MPLDARRRRAILALEEPQPDMEEFLPTSPAPAVARSPLVPPVVQGAEMDHAAVPAVAPDVDAELLAAQGADTDAFNARAQELALRQIVGGITRTAVPGVVSPLGNKEQQLLSGRRQSKLDAIRQLEAQDNVTRADAYGRSVEQNAASAAARERMGERQLGQREKELDARSSADKARAVIAQGELDRRKAADVAKAKKGTGGGGAPKGFPAGWELEGKTHPTPKQGEQFEGLVYSSEKMRGLTADMRKMLAAAGNGRVLPGPEKSRMSQLAKEIQIEGKNIAELGALSGPDYALMEAIAADPTKIDSLVKDMPALLDGLDRWGNNSVDAKARSLGARRSGTKAAPAAQTEEDAAALEWASKHPDDPRAVEIKRSLGVQ